MCALCSQSFCLLLYKSFTLIFAVADVRRRSRRLATRSDEALESDASEAATFSSALSKDIDSVVKETSNTVRFMQESFIATRFLPFSRLQFGLPTPITHRQSNLCNCLCRHHVPTLLLVISAHCTNDAQGKWSSLSALHEQIFPFTVQPHATHSDVVNRSSTRLNVVRLQRHKRLLTFAHYATHSSESS